MSGKATHVGFADESHWNVGRFRSLGLITTSVNAVDALENELGRLLDESEVPEFKWKELTGARERFAGQKLCRFAVDNACARRLRVDVLVWDIEDSRHTVPGRDDVANLQRMYYHLFRNVLRARWPNDAVWRLHPDEHSALDWETVRDCLEAKSTTLQVEPDLMGGGTFSARLLREFSIEDVQPVESAENPLLQLADLFAGMAVFSRAKFDEYQAWLASASPHIPMLGEAGTSGGPSRTSEQRFQLLKNFDDLCKGRKLGVSLTQKRGLWTPRPQNPINFWIYEPQHPEDRAPQRRKG